MNRRLFLVMLGALLVIRAQPMVGQATDETLNKEQSKTLMYQWKKVTDKAAFAPRDGAGALVFKNKMWIIGGDPIQGHYQNDVWSSADGVKWERHIEAAPWHPRQYHDVAVFDDRMWVMEGYYKEGGNRNDVWHSADGVNWTEVPGAPWAPRHAASVFIHDNALWMVAGNNMTPDVWKLTRVK